MPLLAASLSLALALTIAGSDLRAMGGRFSTCAPSGVIAGYMALVAAGLTAVYAFRSVEFPKWSGAFEVFEKPDRFEELLVAIQWALAGR